MKSRYWFTHREGIPIQVVFAHIPGKWFSNGINDTTEAGKNLMMISKEQLEESANSARSLEFLQDKFTEFTEMFWYLKNLELIEDKF